MKTKVCSAFTTSKIVSCTILVAMLLTAFSLSPVFVHAEGSTAQGYEDVSVDTAHSMITNGSFPNLVILDVRYQCEYDVGHLYGAILIPYDQLEARIGELAGSEDHDILVYCKAGSRSQIASAILVEHNFTKVYNVVGGILAWIAAGYPIWTTSHYVTVNMVEEEILLQIDPLLVHLTSSPSCAQNKTCSSGSIPVNVTSTVLEQTENFLRVLVTYEANGTSRDVTISKTLLQSYKELSDEANRTVNFILTEFTSDDLSTQFYSLNYLVHSVDYNFTLYTTLSTLGTEIYNGSFTIMNYAPTGDSKVDTRELVDINSSATLSQLYAVLGKVAKEIGKIYEKSEDANLTRLAQFYSNMNEEAKHLSKLVEKQLLQYNHEILHNSAVIMDMPCGPCGCYNDECGGPSPPPPPAGGCGIACCLACQILCNAFVGGVCILVCLFTLGLGCAICDFLAMYQELAGLGCDAFCQYIGWC